MSLMMTRQWSLVILLIVCGFNGEYSVLFVSRMGSRTHLPVHRSKVRESLRGRCRLVSLTRRNFIRKAVVSS